MDNSDDVDHETDSDSVNVEDSGSSDSEECFDDTDSYYTDIEDEGSSEEYNSDVTLNCSDDDLCGYACDDNESDESEDEDDKCLVEITKPYTPNNPPDDDTPISEYDDVSPEEWGNLKALIMMADGSGIAEWFAKRKVSPEAKVNISKIFSPLNLAARVNSPNIFNFLLGEGFPINTIIHPFLEAALNHKFDIMEKLLDLEADVNVTDAAGTTALHLVARQVTCKPKKIRFLLSKGAHIDQKDDSGMTPLHYALQMGSKGTVVALLRAGADVNIKNGNGKSALHMGLYRGMRITVLLWKAGARPCTVDKMIINETDGLLVQLSEVLTAMSSLNINIVRFFVKRNVQVPTSVNLGIPVMHSKQERVTLQKIVDLLNGAGYTPGNGTDLMAFSTEDIRCEAWGPRTLQELSCFRVRTILRDNPLCITDTVQKLPVPEVIKDYLLLKHVTG